MTPAIPSPVNIPDMDQETLFFAFEAEADADGDVVYME
jgi:hypothetical protein